MSLTDIDVLFAEMVDKDAEAALGEVTRRFPGVFMSAYRHLVLLFKAPGSDTEYAIRETLAKGFGREPDRADLIKAAAAFAVMEINKAGPHDLVTEVLVTFLVSTYNGDEDARAAYARRTLGSAGEVGVRDHHRD